MSSLFNSAATCVECFWRICIHTPCAHVRHKRVFLCHSPSRRSARNVLPTWRVLLASAAGHSDWSPRLRSVSLLGTCTTWLQTIWSFYSLFKNKHTSSFVSAMWLSTILKIRRVHGRPQKFFTGDKNHRRFKNLTRFRRAVQKSTTFRRAKGANEKCCVFYDILD